MQLHFLAECLAILWTLTPAMQPDVPAAAGIAPRAAGLLQAELTQAGAVPITVEGDVVSYVKAVPFKLTAKPGAHFYAWTVPPGVTAAKAKNVLTVTSAPKGTHTFRVTAATVKIDFAAKTFEVVEEDGQIDVSLGEAPQPGPTPPGPTPPDPPSPAPIPANGLHVLVLYETADLAKLTPQQRLILYSQSIRDYLNAKCAMGPDGKTRQWRLWDVNVDASNEQKIWQDAMKRPRQGTPWIIVSNHPKGGYEGPLPASLADALDLLKKWGE